MVRNGDLGSDMMISYRIQAYKKAGLIMGRSGNCGNCNFTKPHCNYDPNYQPPTLVQTAEDL